MCAGSTVWVVEDDREMRESLVWLLATVGHSVEAYGTATELLERYDPNRPGCLLIDLHLPDMNGLELWRAVCERGCRRPFIMISAHGDVATAVESWHQGAMDFIEKPFDHAHLLERVDHALRRDAAERKRRLEEAAFHSLVDSLTRREHEVMELVAEGLLTKQIAKRLGISEKTVEVHRSHVTKKMRVDSVAQLVRLLTKHSMSVAEST